MTYNPLISIIVNCYNGEKFLKESILSILNQTYKNFEIIFWDNLSTDKSKKIIFCFSDSRIKYYSSKTHLKLYKARNEALKNVKGELIALTGPSGSGKSTLNIFIKNPDTDVVYSNYKILKDSNLLRRRRSIFKLPEGYIANKLLKNYCIGLLTIMIKAETLQKSNKRFNEKFEIVGDFALMLELSINCKFKAIQKSLATYRIHQDNISHNKLEEAKELLIWYNENKHIKDFSELENLNFFLQKIKYIKILSNIKKLNLGYIIKYCKELNYYNLKFRLLYQYFLNKFNI